MGEALDAARAALHRIAEKLGPEHLKPLAQACYLVAASDGFIADNEVEHTASTLEQLAGTVEGLRQVREEFVELCKKAERPDETALIADIATNVQDPDARRTLLVAATSVAYADGILDFEEEIVLLTLANALGIAKDIAWALMDEARGRSAG